MEGQVKSGQSWKITLSRGHQAQDALLIRTQGKAISPTPHSLGPSPLHLLTPQWGAPCLSPCWWAVETEALTLERFEAS